MRLFSSAQADKINKVAERTRDSIQAPKKVSAKNVSSELERISKQVLEYFKDSDAILIESKEQLHDYVTKLIESGYAGIDTETTGLDRIHDTIVGSSLYYPGGVECYIPNKHLVPIFDQPYKGQLTYEDVQEEFQRIVDSDVKLIFANADFDLAMIYKDYKVDLVKRCYYDVIIGWRVIREGEQHYDLKGLYNRHVLKGKGDPKKFSDFFSPQLFPYCKPQIAKLYAAHDAKITFEEFKFQLPFVTKSNEKCISNHLERIADLVWEVEMPMIGVCQQLHRNGIYLDKDIAKALQDKYHSERDKELKILQDMVQKIIDERGHTVPSSIKKPFLSGSDFNPTSPLHVKYLLYTLMGIPSDGKKEGTGKDVLNELNLPVTNQILKVRSYGVLINTFVDKMPKITATDGRVHATFRQVGADCITGDSIVPTSFGWRRMDDICSSFNVQEGIHTPISNMNICNMNQISESADSVIQYTGYDVIRIETECGFHLTGTPNHPIMVSKYVSSDNITKGDKRLLDFWEDRRFKNLEDVNVGDWVEVPCNFDISPKEYVDTRFTLHPPYQTSKTVAYLPDKYTEDFAEFLGMYHADGSASFREGTYTIAISNVDEDVVHRVDELSLKLFNIKTSHYSAQKDKNEYETYINCMQIKDIDSILSHGKQNKKIPSAIWSSPSSVIKAYIKGMTLDSSVYYDENGRAVLQLSIIDEDDANFIQQFLCSQGILCYRGHNENKGGWRSPLLSFNADNYMLFRDTIGFVQSSKYIETRPNFKNSMEYRRIGDSFRLKVKNIEYSKDTVYDFHVPLTHSFISNGLISHNTGRMSSADPNLQNIPSHATDIRHMFKASPGYVMMSSDYSQQEPKLTAFVSQDKKMFEAFTHGRDIYATIASIGFNVPYENCLEFHPETHEYQPDGKARRGEAKTVLLGVLYGRSIPSIAEQLYGKRTDMSDKEKVTAAQKVYDSIMNGFPSLRNAMLSAQDHARKFGYTETILGRRRHLPDMQLPEFEFKPMPGYVNPDIDPLDPNTLHQKEEIPKRITDALLKEFKGYKYFGQIVKRTKQLAEDHIRVINNRAKINDATRQCLNCVDSETEILTLSGWKHYDEICEGDEILSFDMDKQRITKDVIKKIHVYNNDTEVIEFKSPTFHALSTTGHRWVCQDSSETRARFITSEHIERNRWPDYPILRVADNDLKSTCSWSDDQIKLFGWIMTDGSINNGRWYGIEICQSTYRPKNRGIYENMIDTLDRLGYQYTDRCNDGVYHMIYINKNAWTYEIFRNYKGRRNLTFDFVSTLDQHQAELLMWSMIECDGTLGENKGNITYTCSSKQKCDVFQYLAFVAGYASSYYETTPEEANQWACSHKMYDSLSNQAPIVIRNSYYTVNVYRLKRAQIYPHHKSRKVVPMVWCVTTGNGTWVARRSSKVYITGNSVIQGSAADMTKMALLNIHESEEWKRLGGRLLVPIHDEILCEFPKENYEEGAKLLSKLMSSAGSFLPFPINCDVEVTTNWYGLEYPCPYKQPESLDTVDPDEVKWIQYMLFECEYSLPKHKDMFGEEFRGDIAKGVDGVYSDEIKSMIEDYKSKWRIESDEDFISMIKIHVIDGITPYDQMHIKTE